MASSSRYRGFLAKWAILREKKGNICKIIDEKEYEESWKLHPYDLKCRLLQMIIGDNQSMVYHVYLLP